MPWGARHGREVPPCRRDGRAGRRRAGGGLLKSLVNPHRLMIVRTPMEGERAVSELKAALKIRQPSLSQHLGSLREVGIISGRREGRGHLRDQRSACRTDRRGAARHLLRRDLLRRPAPGRARRDARDRRTFHHPTMTVRPIGTPRRPCSRTSTAARPMIPPYIIPFGRHCPADRTPHDRYCGSVDVTASDRSRRSRRDLLPQG